MVVIIVAAEDYDIKLFQYSFTDLSAVRRNDANICRFDVMLLDQST